MNRRLPMVGLDRRQRRRLMDFAVLVATLCFLLYVGAEAFLRYGTDFRGYYAAARVVLNGGNPYDYRLVSAVLLEVTGQMGNNPYYYPPWFCLALVPLALLPFRMARLVWIVLTLASYWLGSFVALEVLQWRVRGWRRWLVVLSGAYAFVWLSVRPEQLGTLLFLLLVASLWGHLHDRPGLAGISLGLLLTKPNVTWLTVPFLAVVYATRQRRALWWALAALAVLLLGSTLVLPGWYTYLGEPGFGAGLTKELDGPDQVKSLRMNTVLRDWLGQWGVGGVWYWGAWGALAAGSGVVMWLACRSGMDVVYVASLVSAVGLLLTPYALQYDYPPLILALFWVERAIPQAQPVRRWSAVAILIFVFSVPLWEHPIYEGYWMLLGIILLLLLLNTRLWHRPTRVCNAPCGLAR